MYRKYFILLTIFLIGIISYFTFNLIDTDSSYNEAIICESNHQSCDKIKINETIESCEPWHPWDDPEDLNCNYTQIGVENVTMITDGANHINSPITTEKYEVDYI